MFTCVFPFSLHLWFNPQVLKVLLDKGADPAIRSSWRETAEDVARAHSQLGVVQLLQQHQAVRMRDQAQDSVEREKK